MWFPSQARAQTLTRSVLGRLRSYLDICLSHKSCKAIFYHLKTRVILALNAKEELQIIFPLDNPARLAEIAKVLPETHALIPKPCISNPHPATFFILNLESSTVNP